MSPADAATPRGNGEREPAAPDIVLNAVLTIWQEVLDSPGDCLDPDSNFFLRGGDSLQMTRVLIRVREQLGVALDLREVVRFSTPRKMVECCLSAALAGQATATARALPAGGTTGRSVPAHFPASEGQTGLWLAEQLAGVCGVYNTAAVLHLSGDLQLPVLEQALNSLVRRHELLRAGLYFDTRQQRLFNVITPFQEVRLQPEAVIAHALPESLRVMAAQPFDLARGPLWRFQLFATGPRTWSLLLCLHHCISDGWSGTVLLRHLTEAYNALARAPDWQPPEVDREYRTFCRSAELSADTELPWWREYLAGADRLAAWPLTAGHRSPFAMAATELRLPGHSLQQVQNAAHISGIKLSAFLLTALRVALRSVTGHDELCIGIPVNVRTTSAQERSIGYYVNLLVMRDRIQPEMEALAASRLVQRSLLEVMSHHEAPLPALARALNPALLPSGNPWCDMLFAFQNLPPVKPHFAGLEVDVEALTMPYGQHPLKVEIVSSAGGWLCRTEYAREVLTAMEIESLLSAFTKHITGLAQSICV